MNMINMNIKMNSTYLYDNISSYGNYTINNTIIIINNYYQK